MTKLKLSVGGDVDDLEQLQDIIFLMHDVLGLTEAPAEDRESLMKQLDKATYELATSNVDLTERFSKAAVQIMQLSGRLSIAEKIKEQYSRVINDLTYPPLDDFPFQKAYDIILKEGSPNVKINPINFTPVYEFKEEELKEALKLAICDYNNSLITNAVLDIVF